MKRLHTFMFSVTFAAAILGSTKLLIKPQSHQADRLPIVTTVSYGEGLSRASFTPIDEAGNNSMHKYYAAKTLIKLASHENLSISDKDGFVVSGVNEDNQGNASYRLQQKFDDVLIPGREMIILVDRNDDVEILAGKFETNLTLALRRTTERLTHTLQKNTKRYSKQQYANIYSVSAF
jgi:Zn-dependent metalloprotease